MPVVLRNDYEHPTAGKHAIVASAGLYKAYGVGVADDEKAAVEDVQEAQAVVEVDPVMWMVLAAIDQQRPYVAAVEQWAAGGCRGRPPDPVVVIASSR